MIRTVSAVAVGLAALLLGAPASAITVRGTIYVDRDGSGTLTAGDTKLAGVVVAWETKLFTATADDGSYSLEIPSAGIVWVRSPDGYQPGPSWRAIAASPALQVADLALKPSTATGPLNFVHVTDLHIGVASADEAARAMIQAADAVPAPHFLVATGDLTQGNTEEQWQALADAVARLGVPFVPAAGNHDWYDGGVSYRKHLGPPNYSFDAGGLHFFVLNDPLGKNELLDFIDRDLVRVRPGTTLVAFFHYPPALHDDDDFITGLQERGVLHVFTGHWHANRIMEPGSIINHNIEPLVMAGLDATPGGYEIVSLTGDGELIADHHTTVEHPVVELVHPLPRTCVPPGDLDLLMAVEKGGGALAITVSLDGAAAIPLTFRGGWSFGAPLRVDAPGEHGLSVTVAGHGPAAMVQTTFCVEAAPAPPASLPDWAQLQGGPAHLGAVAPTLEPPLSTVWAHSVGGHIHGGSPVLSAGRLFVPVTDLGDDHSGGLVAYDAVTGVELWAQRFAGSMASSPAVDRDVVIAATSDGLARGFDVKTGAPIWQRDIADGLPPGSASQYGAPAIAGGLAYLTVVRNLAALDTATGEVAWQVNPVKSAQLGQAYASPGVLGDNMYLLTGGGYEGMLNLKAASGAEVWRSTDTVGAIAATPVLSDGFAYGCSTDTTVFATDLRTGRMAWTRKLDPDGFDYAYWVMATPALAGNLLYVPSHKDFLYAVDVSDGSLAWSFSPDPSVIHPAHYKAAVRAFAGSPVVTGDVLWIGGADGILRALDARKGTQLWSQDLGAPIMSGVVPSGPMLFVGTWDGTIRALQSAGGVIPPAEHGSCSVGGGPPTLVLSILLVAFVAWRVLSRRRAG